MLYIISIDILYKNNGNLKSSHYTTFTVDCVLNDSASVLKVIETVAKKVSPDYNPTVHGIRLLTFNRVN
jgi:hypothetical protein